MARASRWIAACLLAWGAGAAARADWIAPRSAAASAGELTAFDRLAVYTINGSGLSADGLTIDTGDGGKEWLSSSGTNGSLTLDLGGPFFVTGLKVWNINSVFGGTPFTSRGMKDVSVLSSLDGAVFDQQLTNTLAQGPGTNTYAGEYLPFAAPVAARYVRITAQNNWGGNYVGLSEVRVQVTNQVLVVAATESSHYSTRTASMLVDGSGMSGAGQEVQTRFDQSGYPNWESNGGPVNEAWVQFDFGSVRHLSVAKVWNHFEYVDGWYNGRGVQSLAVSWSTNGAAWSVLGSYALTQAPQAANLTTYGYNLADVLPLGSNGIDARYVRFNILTNFNGASTNSDYAGLGEVKIFGANPPQPDPPTIVLQPVGGTGNVGGAFTFTASARGTAPLALQWMKDSKPLDGQTNATLTLSNLGTADAGDYMIGVTNSAGSTSSVAAVLVVNRPPMAAGFSTRVVQNQAATLSVPELLARCSDPDGDALVLLSASGGSGGSVLPVGEGMVYTPDPDFSGQDQFTYTISDRRGGSAGATVVVEVIATNAVSPEIVNPPAVLANGNIRTGYAGVPKYPYRVDSATNVVGPWSNLTSVTADSSGQFAFEDPTQPKPPESFYRTSWVDPQGQLVFDPAQGSRLQSHPGLVALDSSGSLAAPRLSFPGAGTSSLLTNALVLSYDATNLVLQYDTTAPDGSPLRITRTLMVQSAFDRTVALETMSLATTGTWSGDLEIRRPFSWNLAASSPVGSIAPLSSGWGQSAALSSATGQWQYILGYAPTAPAKLGLPVVSFTNASARFSVMTDPYYSALIEARVANGNVEGDVRYTYRTSQIPLATNETRQFAWVLARNAGYPAALTDGVNDFFARMMPDVPPGPDWCKTIAMVGYDYLSEGGAGWTNDVAHLTNWLSPPERDRVALCFHGWYESLGGYAFDNSNGVMKASWQAMKTQPMSVDLMRSRMGYAKTNGFHVLLYFGDGLLTDSGFAASYRTNWLYRDPSGNVVGGWTGPDTYGATYAMNPAHPEVVAFYTNYLGALLSSLGDLVDGFVWDETVYIREGARTLQPAPAYCDVAFMKLVKQLRQQVKHYDAQKVFLTSDLRGAVNVPGYAIAADGTYQDSHCNPGGWSYGLFSNWRNTMWSCNWGSISSFDWTRYGVANFGTPVALSNGWEDDLGPSEWTTGQRDRFLSLFRYRLGFAPTTGRFLQEDPATFLTRTCAPHQAANGETIPDPAPGETNWAAAAQGGFATASSTDTTGQYGIFPPSGAIDGNRTDTGWNSGHGWASMPDMAMPVWFQVDFAAVRDISRFVVITYQGAGAATAGKYGLLNYRIQTWNDAAQLWQTVATENRNLAMMTRVHTLVAPVRTAKCRLVVDEVSGGDGVARLLQFEAWGTAP
jgi:hypothetical protein